MNPRHTDDKAREERGRQAPIARAKAAPAVLTLFRVGTRRCRLAAAFVAVMVGLMSQTANQAFAQARQTVLYLDAPAVSTDRASRAGEAATAYSDPGSQASPDALAWLGVPGRQEEPAAPPADAEAAFASVTAPDADGTPAVTVDAAVEAGQVMLAQIEDRAPSTDGGPSESELAAAGAVRPEFGDGTRVPEEDGPAYEAAPARQPETPDLASSPETDIPAAQPPTDFGSAPAAESIAEPSGGGGLVMEAPASTEAPTELAAAPASDEAAPVAPDSGTEEASYGPAGPISEAAPPGGEESVAGQPPAEEPAQAPEVGEEFAEAPDSTNPEPPASEPSEAVETGPVSTPASEPVSTPASTPAPAPASAPADAPAEGADTGPTGGDGEEMAVVPVASPEPADASEPAPSASPSPGPEDEGSEDFAFTEPAEEPSEAPAPESAPQAAPQADDGISGPPDHAQGTQGESSLEDGTSEEQVSEVEIFQDSGTSAEIEASPSDHSGTGGGLPELPEASADDPNDPASPHPDETADQNAGQVPDPQAGTGAGGNPHEEQPPTDDAADPNPFAYTPGAASAGGVVPTGGEAPEQDAPTNAAPADAPAESPTEAAPSDEGGPSDTQTQPGAEGPARPGSGPADQPVPADEPAPASEPTLDPAAGPTAAPSGNSGNSGGGGEEHEKRPDRGQAGPRSDGGHPDRGGNDRPRRGATADPMDRIESIKKSDGGGEDVQDRARAATGTSAGGREERVSEIQKQGSDDGAGQTQSDGSAPASRLLAGPSATTGGRDRERSPAASALEEAEEEAPEGSPAQDYANGAEGPASAPATAPAKEDRPAARERVPADFSQERPETGPIASERPAPEPAAAPRPQRREETPLVEPATEPPARTAAVDRSERREARQAVAEQAAREQARDKRAAYRQQVAAEEAAVSRRAERREARQTQQAEVLAAQQAEARRTERVAARRADREAAAARSYTDPAPVEPRWAGPAYREPVRQPAAVVLPPAQQVAPQRLAPAPQVQAVQPQAAAQPQPQAQQPVRQPTPAAALAVPSGGGAQGGAAGVAGITKSVNRAVGQ